MDLSYLYFQTDNYKYVVYQQYLTQTEKTHYSVKVTNLKDDAIVNFKANPNSVKDTLPIFNNNEKIEESDELFM